VPGNGRVELSFVMQTSSTSSISARENVASASELIAPVIHRSGSAATASQIISLMLNERNEKCQSVSLLGGGGRPMQLVLRFCVFMLKFYIGKPYHSKDLVEFFQMVFFFFVMGFFFEEKFNFSKPT
jgi:hypothetical protein